MRAPALVGIVAALHVGILGSLVLMQGCGTTLDRRQKFEATSDIGPPPEPVFPPRKTPEVELKVASVIQSPKIEAPPAVGIGTTYKLKQGQTLSHVAKHFGISAKALAEFNNIRNVDVVYVGQELKIPSTATNLDGGDLPAPSQKVSQSNPSVSAPSPAAAGSGKYVVQSGDTVSHIAKKYGLKVSDIKQANSLKSDRILVGQSLVIPVSGNMETKKMASTDDTSATTDSGSASRGEPDSRGGVSIPDIVTPVDGEATSTETEPIVEDPAVSPPPETVPISQEKPIVYNVLKGDTIDDIAKLFIVNKQDLLKMNGLSGNEELKLDQEILIPQDMF